MKFTLSTERKFFEAEALPGFLYVNLCGLAIAAERCAHLPDEPRLWWRANTGTGDKGGAGRFLLWRVEADHTPRKLPKTVAEIPAEVRRNAAPTTARVVNVKRARKMQRRAIRWGRKQMRAAEVDLHVAAQLGAILGAFAQADETAGVRHHAH